MWKYFICASGLVARGAAQYATREVDYAQFVNPFIGSEGGIPGYACESWSYRGAKLRAYASQMAEGIFSSGARFRLAW